MTRRILALVLALLFLASESLAENSRQVLAGYLLRSEGKVELKRNSWRGFHAARAGTRLERKDQIRLSLDSEAVILCADFETLWRPPRGQRSDVAQGCRKPAISVSKLRHGLAVASRGHQDSERIRSPRGAIRKPAPRIHWESLGAREYEVQVALGEKTIWGPVLVQGTDQEIPPGFLEPSLPYRVQVRSVGASTFIEPLVPFHLIGADQRLIVAEGEDALFARLQGETTQKQLAHSLYLVHHHLWDEALALLDPLLPELKSSVAELCAADLALGLGFRRGASERYEKARQLADQQGDPETQAEALVGLARTSIKRSLAEKFLMTAMALYAELGDQVRSGLLQQEIDLFLGAGPK